MVKWKHLYNLLKGFLVITLYTAFFGVQLFFNFDLSSQNSNATTYAFQSISVQHHAPSVFKYQKSVSAKNNIRLNKRFQPSGIPDCVSPLLTVTVKYKEHKVCNNDDEALSNNVRLSSYLRGPPVAA